MPNDKIIIKGARTNNLKNINLEFPREKLVVFTGLSGSGKSSLAFDTLYAEGQRRYIESLSSYARMFLGQMDKPDVDSIDGLSPAISIDQKTTSKNPRSTVGTVTEIYDYMRLLYARTGIPHCPVCGKEITSQTVDQIVDKICEMEEGTKIQVLSPIARGKKGEFKNEFKSLASRGFARVRVDGEIFTLDDEIKLKKNNKHNIEVCVDRLVVKKGFESRLSDSIETASKISGGIIIINSAEGDHIFSQNFSCPEHGISVPELTPQMFSFNSPFGACPKCSGIGVFMKIVPELVVPDETKSLAEGCIKATGWGVNSWYSGGLSTTIAQMYYNGLAEHYGFDVNTPFGELPENIKNIIFYGSGDEKIKCYRNSDWGGGEYETTFEGVITNLERRYKESASDRARAEIEALMTECDCPECKGKRLKPESLAVTVADKGINELCDMSAAVLEEFISSVKLSPKAQKIAAPIVKEIGARLNFLKSVGLDYLTLSRSAGTLSGGEAQRIRLATQIGSALTGVLYILDEPSIGLHQRDNDRLLSTLTRLRDLGNSVIVVEHDEDTIRAADYVVDIGPGAGIHGGDVVAAGTPEEIAKCKQSVTGDYLSGRRVIPVPTKRREGNGKSLVIKGAAQNNLKNIDVTLPLGKFICITGVSGSGKSSLVNEVIYKRLANELNNAKYVPGRHSGVKGIEHLDKVIDINQSPIGRTPRSNPATYTGVFGDIRELFALSPDAKMRGYNAGRFSFNVKGGRCEACQGDGIIKIEMNFLPDVYVPCEVCEGKRYNNETLNVHYKGKNIYDVLEMTVEEAMIFFENHPKIYRKLKTIYDVGLGYIKLGQPATTLSGGEAQRVKLSTELSRRPTGKTIYILDEPTTGLHTADVHKLIEVLQRLVDAGNTIVVIEHNLDVIKTADHIIDLGPEGGNRGGEVVAQGTPEEVANVKGSYTGKYLKKML